MLAMPMVRPTLASDLAKLEQEFVHEYREGASGFYITTTNEDGKTQEMLEADKAAWGPICVATLASSPLLTWSFFRLSKGYER
jgi:hypothetical protein